MFMDILAFEYPWISMDIHAKMTWIWIWIWMGFFSSTASLLSTKFDLKFELKFLVNTASDIRRRTDVARI